MRRWIIWPAIVVAYGIAVVMVLWEAITHPWGEGDPVMGEDEVERRGRG